MNKFNAVTVEELNQVEGGKDGPLLPVIQQVIREYYPNGPTGNQGGSNEPPVCGWLVCNK
jgi:hypothetical protein